MLRTRLRAMSGWSDACILNISSRGLMINAPSALAAQGSTIELWHGEHVIVATIVWRRGGRAGCRAEDRVPVDEILAISQSGSLQLTAASWPDVERRRKPRTYEASRVLSRAIEFAAAIVVTATLAGGTFVMVERTLVQPLRHVEAALGR